MLGPSEKMKLELAGGRYKFAALTDRVLRHFLTENAVKFYQSLNRILDDPDAFAYNRELVTRLRRVRGPRTGKRARLDTATTVPRQRGTDEALPPVATESERLARRLRGRAKAVKPAPSERPT